MGLPDKGDAVGATSTLGIPSDLNRSGLQGKNRFRFKHMKTHSSSRKTWSGGCQRWGDGTRGWVIWMKGIKKYQLPIMIQVSHGM